MTYQLSTLEKSCKAPDRCLYGYRNTLDVSVFVAAVREEPLKTLDINPNVTYLWLYIHKERERKKNRHRGLSHKGRPRNVTNKKK